MPVSSLVLSMAQAYTVSVFLVIPKIKSNSKVSTTQPSNSSKFIYLPSSVLFGPYIKTLISYYKQFYICLSSEVQSTWKKGCAICFKLGLFQV